MSCTRTCLCQLVFVKKQSNIQMHEHQIVLRPVSPLESRVARIHHHWSIHWWHWYPLERNQSAGSLSLSAIPTYLLQRSGRHDLQVFPQYFKGQPIWLIDEIIGKEWAKFSNDHCSVESLVEDMWIGSSLENGTHESLSGLMLRTSPFGSLTSTISPDWILEVLSSEFMLEVDILEWRKIWGGGWQNNSKDLHNLLLPFITEPIYPSTSTYVFEPNNV